MRPDLSDAVDASKPKTDEYSVCLDIASYSPEHDEYNSETVTTYDGFATYEEAAEMLSQIERAHDTHDDLVAVCEKVHAWLLRLAEQAENEAARETQFITLREAYTADAANCRATAKHIDAALAKAKGE